MKSRTEIKRQAILTGATEAFKQWGVSHTSMDKVAETAQVSKRTVYNHFESKEALVTQIIKDIWRQNIVNYEYVYSKQIPLQEQLEQLIYNELCLSKDEHIIDLIRVAINYSLISKGGLGQEMKRYFEQETALIKWLKAASLDRRLRPLDPINANDQILNLLKGKAFWPQILRFEPCLSEQQARLLTKETASFFLSYYAAE